MKAAIELVMKRLSFSSASLNLLYVLGIVYLLLQIRGLLFPQF